MFIDGDVINQTKRLSTYCDEMMLMGKHYLQYIDLIYNNRISNKIEKKCYTISNSILISTENIHEKGMPKHIFFFHYINKFTNYKSKVNYYRGEKKNLTSGKTSIRRGNFIQ